MDKNNSSSGVLSRFSIGNVKSIGKRGGSYDLIFAQTFWVMVSFFVIVLVFGVVSFSNLTHSEITFSDANLKKAMLEERIYSGVCFGLYDEELLRSYPNVIDVDRFTNENFDKCMDSDMGFMVMIDWPGAVGKTVKTKNFENADLGTEKDIIIFDGTYHKGTIYVMVDYRGAVVNG